MIVGGDALIGRTIVRVEHSYRGPAKNRLVLTLDDGSTLTIIESSGTGADDGWYTYPMVTLEKDGKELARWKL